MALTRSFITNAATTPRDARRMAMAQIVANTDGTPRTGVLGPVGVNLVTATAGLTLNIAAADFVTSRSASDGVSIFTNDGTVSVPVGAAPVSNSRIDVVWVKHNDNTQGDADALPVFGVTPGVAAASPIPAAIPTGAEELAQFRMYAGTTATNGGSNTVTQTARYTAARGGVVPFRTKAELDAWTTAGNAQEAITIDDGQRFVRNAGKWGGAPVVGTTFRKTNAYTFGSSSSTVVAWNAADFQTDDFSHTSGTFTFARPGIYLFSFCITVAQAAAVGSIAATLRRNGSSVAQVLGSRSTSGAVGLTGAIALAMAVGDTVTLDAVSSGTSTAADVTGGRNFISVTPVR